jgi:hypothetical protein
MVGVVSNVPPVPSASHIAVQPGLLVRVYPGFDKLPNAYASLFEQTTPMDFHLTIPWFRNFVRTALDPGDRILLYGVETDQPALKAIALLPMKHRAAYAFWEPRVLSSLANYYTCFFEPLIAGGSDANACIRQIASAIRSDEHDWDIVRVAPLACESSVFRDMRQAFEAVGFATQEFFSFGNWYLPVEGRSFQDYMFGRPSVLQNTLRRKSKKFEQTGRGRIEIITGSGDIERAIEDYETVYNSSWKVPEPYSNFVAGLIRTCAENGWLRLGLAYMDDVPVASQLWIVHQGVASIYKLAYDERVANLSVGTILTARLMEHALDVDHVREVDYLSGDDEYKRTWMSQRRERWGFLAFNLRTLKGTLSVARHIGGRILRQSYQKMLRKAKADASTVTISQSANDS